MKALRGIKIKEEIAVIETAIDITHKTFERICRFVKPGVMEYEIEAEIYHEFLRNRATGEAYGSIIASGDRARTLHYVSNKQALYTSFCRLVNCPFTGIVLDKSAQ